jgi:hypothetical protein
MAERRLQCFQRSACWKRLNAKSLSDRDDRRRFCLKIRVFMNSKSHDLIVVVSVALAEAPRS